MTQERRPLRFNPAAAAMVAVGSLLLFASTNSSNRSTSFALRRDSPNQGQDDYQHRTLANLLDAFADPKSVELRDDSDVILMQPPPVESGGGEVRRRLIHVSSPYHDPSSTDFAPLDFEQWSMLASVKIAQERFHQQERNADSLFDEVVLVCAILEEDASALSEVLPPYCQHVVVMPRSTATEYPYLKPKPLPFIQDTLDAGINEAMAESLDDEYYVMLTNADICLTPDFYSYLERTMRQKNSNALSLNRMTIDMNYVKMPIITDENNSFEEKHAAANYLLEQARDAYGNNHWEKHPGVDCFIMHSSVSKMIRMGDMFGGYPYWDRNFDLALSIMGTNYEELISHTGGTFHFGNANDWLPKGNLSSPKLETMAFWKEFGSELQYLLWCPIMKYPPQDGHSLQELINCGKWFQPTEQSNPIPAFVQPGYEQVYLEKFAKYLSFTENGFPRVFDKSKPTPEQKMTWIRQYAPQTINM